MVLAVFGWAGALFGFVCLIMFSLSSVWFFGFGMVWGFVFLFVCIKKSYRKKSRKPRRNGQKRENKTQIKNMTLST